MRAFLGLLFVAGLAWMVTCIVYGLRTGQYYGALSGLAAMAVAVGFWRQAVDYDERSHL